MQTFGTDNQAIIIVTCIPINYKHQQLCLVHSNLTKNSLDFTYSDI